MQGAQRVFFTGLAYAEASAFPTFRQKKNAHVAQCYHQDILRCGSYQTGILTEFQPSFLLLIKSFQSLLLACFVAIHKWLALLLNAVDTLFP